MPEPIIIRRKRGARISPSPSPEPPDENAQGQQVFVVLGDSTARGNNNSEGPGPTPTAGTAYYYRSSNNTVIEIGANDLEFARNVPVTGSPWPQFAIDYNAQNGKKAVIVPCGFGGAEFYPNGDNNNWYTSGDNYALMISDVTNTMNIVGVGKPKAILISCGINDARGAQSLSNIEGAINSLVSRLQSSFPNTDILIYQIGRSEVNLNDSRISAVRGYIKNTAINNSGVYLLGGYTGAFAAGYYGADEIHLKRIGSNAIGAIGARWFANSTYSKWARSIICSHYDNLSSQRKSLISPVDSILSSYLSHEFIFNFRTTIEQNLYHDWSFLTMPGDQGSFTFTANDDIELLSASSEYFDQRANLARFQYSSQNDFFLAAKNIVTATPAGTRANLMGAHDGNGYFIAMQQDVNSQIRRFLNDATSTYYATDSKFQNDTEYIVARNGTSNRLYKNGSLVSDASVASLGNVDADIPVGASNQNGTLATFISANIGYVRGGRETTVNQSEFYSFIESVFDGWNS